MDIVKNFAGAAVMLHARGAMAGTTRNSLNEMGLLQQYFNTAAAYFPLAAAKVEMSPTAATDIAAGTGAQKVLIIGLDANYELQYEEIATGAAQYGITKTTKLFTRVFGAEVTVAGSSFNNAGDIWFTVDGLGGVYATGIPGTKTSCWMKMSTGLGMCTSGLFTVPKGRRVRLESLSAGCRTQPGELFLFSSNIGSATDNALHLELSMQLSNAGAVQMDFPKPPNPTSLVFGEKVDLHLQALSTTAAGVVSAMACFRWE